VDVPRELRIGEPGAGAIPFGAPQAESVSPVGRPPDRDTEGWAEIDRRVGELFALVTESLAGATETLLGQDRAGAQALVDHDDVIDGRVREVEQLAERRLADVSLARSELPRLVALLQILPELERSADLAEHIAQRGAQGLGAEMTPRSRGLVQRMAEVGCEMWRATADAYAEHSSAAVELDEADEELDVLHDELTLEVARGLMPTASALQLVLVARFYERLGDHAVNLARRVARLAENPA
jgi:phosphate transport system protein